MSTTFPPHLADSPSGSLPRPLSAPFSELFPESWPGTVLESLASLPPFLRDVLASPWLKPLNDTAAIDDLLQLVDPLWSLSRIRARVVRVKREAPGVTTLALQANRLWPGHAAGQHVAVEVDVEGRRLRRTFSVSSAPQADRIVEITAKQREGGPVSTWWNTRAAVGDVMVLGEPRGGFVLPAPLPRRLVMLAAGSGITPLMAMLRDLAQRRADCDVLLVASARTADDLVFAEELRAMARRGNRLQLHTRFTARDGRLEPDRLAQLAREAGDAPAFACGPDGFVAAVREAWAGQGAGHLLRVESFGAPRTATTSDGPVTVHASRSGRDFVALPGQSLLEAAEAAGLRPAYGCRAGICHECRCRKLEGIAVDLRNGRAMREPGETVQLCIAAARGPLTLDL